VKSRMETGGAAGLCEDRAHTVSRAAHIENRSGGADTPTDAITPPASKARHFGRLPFGTILPEA
jgi:hypothetical protein